MFATTAGEAPISSARPRTLATRVGARCDIAKVSAPAVSGNAYGLLAVNQLYNCGFQVYNSRMITLASSDARKNFADAVRQAQSDPVVIEKRGQREAVIIAPELFDRFVEAAEELEDITAFDAAMEEEGDNIPWDEVKAELGWV